MINSITVKITKAKDRIEENGKNYAVYDVEPFNYGDHSYSQIKIEYQEESDLNEFVENKSIKIEVGRDMTLGEGDALLIIGGAWNPEHTVWQKIKDKTKETTEKVGDTSSEAVKKTGEGLTRAGEKLKESADKDKWTALGFTSGNCCWCSFINCNICLNFQTKKEIIFLRITKIS